MKKIAILGASGSIGTSTLNVIRNHSDKFELVAFSVYNNIPKIALILDEFKTVKLVSLHNSIGIFFIYRCFGFYRNRCFARQKLVHRHTEDIRQGGKQKNIRIGTILLPFAHCLSTHR